MFNNRLKKQGFYPISEKLLSPPLLALKKVNYKKKENKYLRTYASNNYCLLDEPLEVGLQ